MAAVKWLTCSECGQKRWSAEETVCVMTPGCTGRMKREGQDIEQNALFPEGSCWAQQRLSGM